MNLAPSNDTYLSLLLFSVVLLLTQSLAPLESLSVVRRSLALLRLEKWLKAEQLTAGWDLVHSC